MKIEKTRENQIVCTIDAQELADRQLRLSDLTYGSPAAQRLFEEVMQQAADEYGFTAGDIPLMVEAVPLGEETLMFIITKVEFPEELDTRFSRFTPAPSSSVSTAAGLLSQAEKFFARLGEAGEPEEEAEAAASMEPEEADKETEGPDPFGRTRVYSFSDMDRLAGAAALIPEDFLCESSLYRSPEGRYILLFTPGSSDGQKAVLNMISEYGSKLPRGMGSDTFVREHYRVVIPSDAISVIRTL